MESPEVLLARIDERQKSHDKKLDAILKQVTATNGRVTKLEDERLPKLEHWKSRVHGIYLTLGALAAVAAFIIGVLVEFGK